MDNGKKEVVKCQQGHKDHKTKIVPTRIGALVVYDCDKYENNIEGYCNGKDDISRTLIEKGSWEDQETTDIIHLLSKNRDYAETQRVIDFGCHIGWYTIIAANMGYNVEAFDNDAENLDIMMTNARNYLVDTRVKGYCLDIRKGSKHDFKARPEVELVKIDLEGNEQYAIDLVRPLLEKRCVKHIHMEVSPVFNNSYPSLVKELLDYGFTAYLNNVLFDGTFDFDQANLLFKRDDLP